MKQKRNWSLLLQEFNGKRSFQQYQSYQLIDQYKSLMDKTEAQYFDAVQNQNLEFIHQDQYVFQDDRRTTIQNPYKHPFCSIGKIHTHYTCAPITYGTGFFIAKNMLITAAHNIIRWNQKQQRTQNPFGIYFVLNVAENQKINFKVKTAEISKKYNPKIKETCYDFAILYLQQPEDIKVQNQKFGFLRIHQNYIMQDGQNVVIGSFQRGKDGREVQDKPKAERGMFLQIVDSLIKHRRSTNGGDSGFPYLVKFGDNQYKAIGLHKGCFNSQNKAQGYNVGIRFSSEVMNQINQLIQKLLKKINPRHSFNDQIQNSYEGLLNQHNDLMQKHHQLAFDDQSFESNFQQQSNDTETITQIGNPREMQMASFFFEQAQPNQKDKLQKLYCNERIDNQENDCSRKQIETKKNPKKREQLIQQDQKRGCFCWKIN